jgi:Holliday junction resolvase RusA-like endonuclease
MKIVELRVHGQPAFVRGGRAIVTEGKGKGRESHAAWRQAVATAARDWQDLHHQALLDGPLAVRIEFLLHKPASTPKRKIWADRKPDLDKLVRSVLDAVDKVVIAEDSRVVSLTASKRYALDEPPGALITITEQETPAA